MYGCSWYDGVQKDSRLEDKILSIDFSENKDVKEILKRYPVKRSALIPLLLFAQEHHQGWLPQKVLEDIACFFKISFAQIMEVVTFYSMFNVKPVGCHIKICRTLSCWLRGGEELADLCENKVNLKMGESNGTMTLSYVECLGYCDQAPVAQINSTLYACSPQKQMDTFLKSLEKKQERR